MEGIWKHARALRNDPTDAERHLWQHLRGRRLAGFKFRRQYPIAGRIADFACIEANLVIELDGGQHLERSVDDAAVRAGWSAMAIACCGSGMTTCC